LIPVIPSKKVKEYHLLDVIGCAIITLSETGQRSRISICPEKESLYKRYLLDKCEEACQKFDASIMKAVHESAREKIYK